MAINNRPSIYIFIFIALFIISTAIQPLIVSAWGQQLPQLIHFPVNTGFEGQNINLEAKFENLNIQVVYVRIYYRIKGSEDYQYLDMNEETEKFVGFIPASEVKAPAMEYFILALLSDQNIVTSPSANPFYNPYEITITKSAELPVELQKSTTPLKVKSPDTTATELLILSPEPDSKIEKEEVVIAVSFLFDQGGIDKSSVQLFIDRKNVTSLADITDFMISYVPRYISYGKHSVKFFSKDLEGNTLSPLEWNFWVVKAGELKAKKKLPFSGRLFADIKDEKVSNNKLTTINSGVNFHGKYGSIRYKGLAFITSREKSDQQPRNRFLLDVGTSWIGMRFGDTNPRFNDLILWGKRVRGIEAYLKLGFFNLEFVHGETNRAIAGKLYNLQNDTLWINPDTGDTVQTTDGIYKYGTFKQTLIGIRPSFGRGRNFQFGLNLLKVKDDMGSIKYGINPKDNIVIGPDLLFAFDRHRIELKAGAAFSILTNDISTGPLTKAELDTTFDTNIPLDPAELKDILILNTSTTPLNPAGMTSLAYNVQFKFNYFKNFLRIQYKSIGSEFNSLGNTFLRKNIQGFSVSDRIRVFQNQVYLTLRYEQYIDGLEEKDDGNPNTQPTNLKTFNIGISYYPRGIDLPKVSLTFKNHDRNNGLDTLNAVGNLTQDISVQLGYDLHLFNLDHTFSLSIIGSDRIDDFNPNTSNLVSDIKMFTFKTKYQIPLTTTFTLATNQSKTGKGVSSTFSFKYNLIGLNANYMLLNQRLKINGGINITSAVGTRPVNNIPQEYTNYKRTAFNVGGNFQITPKQYLLLDAFIISFKDKAASSYNDSILRIRYELRY